MPTSEIVPEVEIQTYHFQKDQLVSRAWLAKLGLTLYEVQ